MRDSRKSKVEYSEMMWTWPDDRQRHCFSKMFSIDIGA